VEKLTELFTENKDRRFSVGRYAQMWLRTREGYAQMLRTPGVSYKCGVHALNNLALQLYGTNVVPIVQAPSPVGGFTLAQLWSYSDAYQLGLAPVLRESGDEIIVPSLVHRRQNHYAAIIARHGDRYEVIDPTFGEQRQMMDAQTLNAEASGYFMIRPITVPLGWRGESG
jgi:ABC-type bacteriocin/lantibiotic exporter with double-glycine peptidase domain